MATKLQRAKAILDAIADPTVVDNTLALRIGNAFAIRAQLQSDVIDVSSMTPTEKADVMLTAMRAFVQGVVRQAEVGKALHDKRLEVEPTTPIDLGVG